MKGGAPVRPVVDSGAAACFDSGSICHDQPPHFPSRLHPPVFPMSTRFMLRSFGAVSALFVFSTFVWLSAGSKCAGEEPAGARQMWLYYPTNLLVDSNIDRLEPIFRRAAKAGFSHVLLEDSKFANLQGMPREYFRNVDRVKRIAREVHLELVPGVFPIGWSNAMLFHDPNLAAGLPVRDQLFVVHDGEARIVADPPVALPPGNLADIKHWSWKDPTVSSDEGGARFSDLNGRPGRIVQVVKVSPFRQYRISVRIKTKNFHGTPEIKVIGDRPLNYNGLHAKSTEDWKTHWTVFNSLDNHEVSIYFGTWDGGKGSLWFSDAHLEEVGLLNVLRRPGAPVTVRRDTGSGETSEGKRLVEGTDFQPIADPHLGNNPYPGEYDLYHQPPVIHTRLPDGTRLRVSYYHPMIIYDGSVMIALSEPKTMALLREEAKGVHAAFGAKAYFMDFDEIRLFNWDAASERRHLDAGPLLGDTLQACTKILRDVNPGGKIYVWSDMFDPKHNAVKQYYLVNGSLLGSWNGLDRDVVVANWNFEHRDASLKFFTERGNPLLIAGYYDAPLSNLRAWLDSAEKAPGASAVMYTTWANHYDDLEKFAAAVKAHPWWKGAAKE